MAIAPAQSAAAGFNPRDVFVTEGPNVYKISGGIVTLFADRSRGASQRTTTGLRSTILALSAPLDLALT